MKKEGRLKEKRRKREKLKIKLSVTYVFGAMYVSHGLEAREPQHRKRAEVFPDIYEE